MKSPREIVQQYYPDAIAVNVGCKKGDYYNITCNGSYLGQGKSKAAAWKAASRNLDN